MGQCKASNVDNFVAKPNKSIALILLYGPDQGLVSERADILSTKYGIQIDEAQQNNYPLNISRFDADDIASDPQKLADEAYAISMFGDAKLIRLKGTTRKNLQPALKPILHDPPPNCWIIFEGGDLKRDSALRKLVEKSPGAMALPCFHDSAGALEQLIKEEITANNLEIDSETRHFLKSFLGDDRRASRNELKKLALYAHGEKTITRDQILALLGNVSSVDNDDVIDAACLGQIDFLQSRLDQLLDGGVAPDMLIWASLRHFQMLHQFRAMIDNKNTSVANIISGARPPLHFSRRDKITKSLQMWPLKKLDIALQRLDNAFYETRSKPTLAHSIAATTLLAIALQAVRR